MAYRITRLDPEHIPMLSVIERRAGRLFAEVGMPEIAQSSPLPATFLKAALRSGEIFTAVREDMSERKGSVATRPVGFIVVAPLDRCAHIYELSVDPDHGQKGLGRRLVEQACDWGAAQGLEGATLSTFRSVPWNAPFYRRAGFRILNRDEWTPALHILRVREQDAGLPIKRRCFMRRDFDQ